MAAALVGQVALAEAVGVVEIVVLAVAAGRPVIAVERPVVGQLVEESIEESVASLAGIAVVAIEVVAVPGLVVAFVLAVAVEVRSGSAHSDSACEMLAASDLDDRAARLGS